MASGEGLRPNPTAGFKRDLKRLAKRGKDLAKIGEVVDDLRLRRPLASRHRDHALLGKWRGWRDCHVEPDWLLIYRVDEAAGELILGRTGSHADLVD